ncbi:MAG TPA: dienelactone hydrolase family protein [Thermoanaerobaculia bacterium]|nr:dienelactone hydrolase family protein [Thermoanaerobaculia bacterium]
MKPYAAASAAILLLAAGGARAAEPGKISSETITSRGKPRTYALYVPTGTAPDVKLPLLVALHGSTSRGDRIVSIWKDEAEKDKIVVAGPDSADPVHWASPYDGPLFLHDIVEEVAGKYPIDRRRVYLFGHSAGAVFALQMAALESEYFAAAVISAGSLYPEYFRLFAYATRKIPYFLIIGTKDQFFPLSEVTATRDALKTRGFPVEYWEIPGYDHGYRARAGEINPRVWDFLQRNPLPAEPKYTVYQ